MDKITLPEKGMEFIADFAAPSVLTGRFVASIVDSDAETVRGAFTAPGIIRVESVEGRYAPAEYAGYDRLDELTEGVTITVKLSKGESDGQGTV